MYHPKLLQGWWWYMNPGYALDTTNIPKMKECLLESGRCLMQTEEWNLPFFKVGFKYTKKFLAVDTIDVIGLYIFVQLFYKFIFIAFTHTLTTFVFDLFVGSAPKGRDYTMTCRLGSSVLSSSRLFSFSDPYLGQRYYMTSCLFKLLLQSGSKNTSA